MIFRQMKNELYNDYRQRCFKKQERHVLTLFTTKFLQSNKKLITILFSAYKIVI